MSDYQFNPDQEQWKAITGFPGYEVSDHGRVRSYRTNHGKIAATVQKYPKPIINCRGYAQHNLSINGQKKVIWVHKLVLLSFDGPCPSGQECRHRDGNKINNRRSNLCWGTPIENASDRILHGTQRFGETHGNAKLTDSEIIEIRRLISIKCPRKQIAAQFSISIPTVYAIGIRKIWRHI